jgi:hypothetical protein
MTRMNKFVCCPKCGFEISSEEVIKKLDIPFPIYIDNSLPKDVIEIRYKDGYRRAIKLRLDADEAETGKN